ncbi:PAAR domain-containing protein [Acinetobacter soli]|uniref:PAAR domain-containing protein n=1 Tax=Acinetobacter soli TaxID=487316 RepID=A0A1P8ENB1_9GAMM|nr:PAAR domain-containing protein [Acinetobacter soli]APV37731.1 hypothetical protein BEN76_16930 [Acinetobacter soli]
MASPIFLHELPIEQLQQMSQEDIEQTLKAERLYFQHRPKTMYYLAVNGSKTKQGGLVKASATQGKIGGLSIARIGDEVIYADGTVAKIVSGAGKVCIVEGLSAALVGSQLDNGDEIEDSPNCTVAINIFKGEPLPDGFLIPEGVDHG